MTDEVTLSAVRTDVDGFLHEPSRCHQPVTDQTAAVSQDRDRRVCGRTDTTREEETGAQRKRRRLQEHQSEERRENEM